MNLAILIFWRQHKTGRERKRELTLTLNPISKLIAYNDLGQII